MSRRAGSGSGEGPRVSKRRSLSSLLFPPASAKAKERQAMSRSANDLVGPSSSSSRRATAPELAVTEFTEDTTVAEPEEAEEPGESMECGLCFDLRPSGQFPRLQTCQHRFCLPCLRTYLETEIGESRVKVACAECPEPLHPSDVYRILGGRSEVLSKYEEFALRRILMADPDTRWCPAPDCAFAVIASGCAACPELRCEAPGCGAAFCYHCKATWHPHQTCDEARALRGGGPEGAFLHEGSVRAGDIKACPRCRTYIVKMNDGSCNHMICAICGAEFCWLCLKEISDLHYLSPSGCTFWGKKPWSRKKKLMWQLGTLVGAPVGITLIAGLAVPAIIIGVPVFVGRKVHQRAKKSRKWAGSKGRLAVAGSVAGTFLLSPVLATMAVGVGVPIMLAYVYGVVPLSLCRNGNCGVSASSSGVRLDLDEEPTFSASPDGGALAGEKLGLLSRTEAGREAAATSIHSGGSSLAAPARTAHFCGRRRGSVESGGGNYEEASTRAMAGSTYADDKSLHTLGGGSIGFGGDGAEDEASTRALAGSVVDAKSICGVSLAPGDTTSVRGGSLGPVLVTVETHAHYAQRSDRGSPAPLLEEDPSCGEEEEEALDRCEVKPAPRKTSRSGTATSDGIELYGVASRDSVSSSGSRRGTERHSRRLPSASNSAAPAVVYHHSSSSRDDEEGEFLLLSADAYHQLHPMGPPPTAPQKARSVSLLLENSAGELWQMFSEPNTVLDRLRGRSSGRHPGKAPKSGRKSSGSYTCLAPDPGAASTSRD